MSFHHCIFSNKFDLIQATSLLNTVLKKLLLKMFFDKLSSMKILRKFFWKVSDILSYILCVDLKTCPNIRVSNLQFCYSFSEDVNNLIRKEILEEKIKWDP